MDTNIRISERQRVHGQLARARRMGARATLTLAEWERIISDFGGWCAYCLEKPFDVMEHFAPVALAGTTPENCVPACYDCNLRKGNRTGQDLIDLFGEETIHRINQYLSDRDSCVPLDLPHEALQISAKQTSNRGSPRRLPANCVIATLTLPSDLVDWAKRDPEYLAGLVRRLLEEERKRLESPGG